MVFRITNDRHSSAIGSYHIAFGNGFFGVVSTFCVNVRLQREQKFSNGRLVKDCHEINCIDGRD